MALAKKTNTPAFEDVDLQDEVETITETATETVTATATTPTQETVMQTTTTAIAPAKTTALGAPKAPAFSAALQDYQNRLDIDQVRSLGVGTLPKLVADRGGFTLGEGKDQKELGDWTDIHILSFNSRWLASAGIDGEEGKEHLRTSYDGVTLEDEVMDTKEYVQYLKDQGFDKASIRQYIDIWGFVANSDKGGPVEQDDFELVQVQLSPSSVKEFTAYQLKAGVTASLTKREPSNTVRATIDKREFGGNRYAAIKFSAAD